MRTASRSTTGVASITTRQHCSVGRSPGRRSGRRYAASCADWAWRASHGRRTGTTCWIRRPGAVERAGTGSTFVVGRHSRPDPLKWPATREQALLAYPTAAEFEVRILGADPAIARFLAPVPENWRLLPFGAVEVREFLRGLDAYVSYHHPRWVEAFGRTLLEAMATGLPTVLPEQFRELFGEAALYAEPAEAVDVLHRLREDPDWRREQGARAQAVVAERFSSAHHVERLRAILGAPAASPAPRARRGRTRAVLHLQRGRARPRHPCPGDRQALPAGAGAGVRDPLAGRQPDRGGRLLGRVPAVPRLSRRRYQPLEPLSRRRAGRDRALSRPAGDPVRRQHALLRPGAGAARGRARLERLGAAGLLARRAAGRWRSSARPPSTP